MSNRWSPKIWFLSYFWLVWGTPQPALSGSLEDLMHFFLIFGYYCEGDKRTKYSHISWCRIVFLALKHQCWIQCRSTGPSSGGHNISTFFGILYSMRWSNIPKKFGGLIPTFSHTLRLLICLVALFSLQQWIVWLLNLFILSSVHS